MHPEDWRKRKKFFTKHSGKLEQSRGEYRLKDIQGNWRWFDGKMVARKNEEGKIIGYYCIDRDITVLKNTEAELKKAKQRAEQSYPKIQGLLKANPDMMFVFHKDGTILDSHTGHNQKFYSAQEDFLHRNIREIFPEDVTQITFEKIGQVIQTGKTLLYNYALTIDNKESTFEARIVYLDHEKTLAIIRDITERTRMFQELEEAKEKAEESDRLKSSFLATMSHDLRTPLNAIIGFSSLLCKNENLHNISEYSDIIYKNGNHLLNLINSILNISSIEAGNVKFDQHDINLQEFMDNLKSITKSETKARKKCHLNTYFNPDPSVNDITIVTDGTKLNQIMVNLLGNAIKYTEEGYIEVGYYKANTNFCFYVSDSGPGISRKNQKLIFDRFYQLNNTASGKSKGVGLGLSISKKLADLLGAKLTLDSTPGKGSIFSLILPNTIIRESNTPLNEPSEKAEETIEFHKTLNILIAEDEISNYMLIEAILIQKNCRLFYAKNGKQAIELLRDYPEIHLILMDIKMPEIDGLEATHIIKKTNPDMPIIAITAHAMQGDQNKALEAGCDNYISKPINKNTLIRMIREMSLQ